MIDYSERNIVHLADIIFYQGEESEMTIHCLCSRAYVNDRELYRSDLKAILNQTDSQLQDFEANDGEELLEDLNCSVDDEDEEEEAVVDEETMLMASLGLPVEFASSSKLRKAGQALARQKNHQAFGHPHRLCRHTRTLNRNSSVL